MDEVIAPEFVEIFCEASDCTGTDVVLLVDGVVVVNCLSNGCSSVPYDPGLLFDVAVVSV